MFSSCIQKLLKVKMGEVNYRNKLKELEIVITEYQDQLFRFAFFRTGSFAGGFRGALYWADGGGVRKSPFDLGISKPSKRTH